MSSIVKQHSRLGASTAHRWFKCPGSPRMCEKVGDQGPMKYADQGTAAHWVLLDECLHKPKARPSDYVGVEAPNGVTLTSEDCEAVDQALNHIRSTDNLDDFDVFTEVRFHLDTIHPDLWGTCDLCLAAKDRSVLKVRDYKHGSGVPVEVEENTQLQYYGLGAIQHLNSFSDLEVFGFGNLYERVELEILQPRCQHRDGPFRLWSPDADKIHNFATTLQQKALVASRPDAPLHAGDHCRWCPAKAYKDPVTGQSMTCPEFERHRTEVVKSDFRAVSDPSNLNLPSPREMSLAERLKILSFEPILKEWFQELNALVYQDAMGGVEVPGFKLVESITHRKWSNEEEALLDFEKIFSVYEIAKMKSPAQVEKLLRNETAKELFSKHVVKPQGRVVLAKESDRRPAIHNPAELDFERIEDDGG